MAELTITAVESTFKSPDGKPWRLELGPKVLLLGDNGDGKSAVLQALEAALTGEVDLEGKSRVRDPSLLIELAHGSDQPGATAHTKVFISNGDTAEWTLTRREDGTLPQQPDTTAPKCIDARVLPMRTVQDVLSAERKVGEKALLSWAGATLSEGDVLGKLPGIMHTRFKEIAEARAPGATMLEQLLGVQDYGKTTVQSARNELLACKRLVEGLSTSLGAHTANPTEAMIAEVDQDIAQLHEALVAHQVAASKPKPPAPETVRTAYEELTALWHRGAAADQALRDALEHLGQLQSAPPPPEDPRAAHVQGLHQAAIAMLNLGEEAQTAQCFACGLPGLHDPQHRAALRDFHNARAVQVPPERLAVQAHAAQVTESIQRVDAARAELTRLQESYARAQDTYARLQAAQAAAPTSEEETQLDGSQADLAQELQQKRQRLAEAKGRWDQVDAARNQVVAQEAALRTDLAFFGAVDDLVKRLSIQATQAFHAHVQKHMPPDWTFATDLTGTKRIRIGLRGTDGQVHSATLSGGQRIAVDVALALAVALPPERSSGGKAGRKPGEPQLRVVTLPDKDISDSTRLLLMRTWGAWPGQVILTATDKPKGRIPAGWTVVDVRDVFPQRKPSAAGTPVQEQEALPEPEVGAAAPLPGDGEAEATG